MTFMFKFWYELTFILFYVLYLNGKSWLATLTCHGIFLVVLVLARHKLCTILVVCQGNATNNYYQWRSC
jgi:hypothetical protein